MRHALTAFTLALLAFSVPAIAADEAKKEDTKAKMASFLAADNPQLAELNKKTEELTKSLNEHDAHALFAIRHIYGTTQSVKTVKADVGKAVELCSKENTDLKQPMSDRYKQWTDAVDSAVEKLDSLNDVAIKAQTYMKPKEIHAYLNLVKKAADKAELKIDKKPLTDKASCEGLLKSMDETQPKIVTMLTQYETVLDEFTKPASSPSDAAKTDAKAESKADTKTDKAP